MKLIHVSDLHVKILPKDNENVHTKLAGVRALMGPGDKLVVTGDITEDGLEAQYQNALELLKPFKGRLVMCPGSHDYGLLGSFYDPHAEKRWKHLCEQLHVRTYAALEVGGFVVGQVMALDTCIRKGSPIDFAQGEIGFFQLRRLRKFLKETFRHREISVVILHNTPFHQDWYCRLKGSKEFLDAVIGKADYVLMGHEHKERRSWYPMNGPESKAITRIYSAQALNSSKTEPTLITLRRS